MITEPYFAISRALAAEMPRIHASCRASVIVPARNEEGTLTATLDALRLQVECDSVPMAFPKYEVLLLLNNCGDRSAAVAHRYAQLYPAFSLHVLQCELAPEQAHVGTARRILMDIACERLEGLPWSGEEPRAILSTDADSLVAPDWIAQNLAEIEAGVDAVGGKIHLSVEDLQELPAGTRLCYERDAKLQRRVAQLESLLDPDAADPWPRHLQHFGASLACTPAIYRASGGLPPVKPLEDVAFVDALRKAGARLRHSPKVKIVTSSRLDGRAEVGLSGQLRLWTEEYARALPQMVESAEWMMHRFQTLAALRRLNASAIPEGLEVFPVAWQDRILQRWKERLPVSRFLEALDCNALIEEMFEAKYCGASRRAEILLVIQMLDEAILRFQAVPARRF